MTTIDKNEAGRLMPQYKSDMIEWAQQIDRENAVSCLLCLDDAYDSLGNVLMKGLVHPELRNPEDSKLALFAAHSYVNENSLLIHEALETVLEQCSRKGRSLSVLPGIEIGLDSSDSNTFINRLVESGKLDLANDLVVSSATPALSNDFEVTELILLKSGNDKDTIRTLNQVLGLLLLIRRFHATEMAIKFNTTLTLEDGQPIPHVNYPSDHTLENIEKVHQRSQRQLLDSDYSIEWASDYKKASADSLLTIGDGLYSPSNRSAVMKEIAELVSAYSSLAGFENTFSSAYGYSLAQFRKVCECLLDIALPNCHTVYRGEGKELVKKVKGRSVLSNSVVDKVLISLTWRAGLESFEAPILPSGSDRIFSWRYILGGLISRLDSHLSSPRYSNDIGELFERRCRDALRTQGFEVYPSRLDLPFEYLPREISIRLWKHIRSSTDVDVIARKDRFLFIFECKERNATHKGKIRRENLFSRTATDLKFKTLWLRDNQDTFSGLLGLSWTERLLHDRSTMLFIPILVSNFPVENDEFKIALLTYSELGRLAQAVETPTMRTIENEAFLSLEKVTRGQPNRTWAIPANPQ